MLRDLDGKMGGLQPSDLDHPCRPPIDGKDGARHQHRLQRGTRRARSLARARRSAPEDPGHDGAVVGFFSLEMSAEQLATRILSEQAGIPSEKIRRGMIDESEFKRLVEASQEMAAIPAVHRPDRRHLHRPAGGAGAQAQAPARPWPDRRRLSAAADRLVNGESDNRVQEVSEITTGLKALAKELNVPIMALSQLSRAVENREDKRPQLADLRESGSIEQDADVVMFVFREEYYVERTKPAEGTLEFQDWMAKMQMVSGKAEVIIGKQRHGPIGTVQLQFEANVTRFSDLAREAYVPERLG